MDNDSTVFYIDFGCTPFRLEVDRKYEDDSLRDAFKDGIQEGIDLVMNSFLKPSEVPVCLGGEMKCQNCEKRFEDLEDADEDEHSDGDIAVVGAKDIKIGDFVECVDGSCGHVTSICSVQNGGNVIGVNIGDEWVHVDDIQYWHSED